MGMLKLLKKHCKKKRCPLAGNSVHVDRQFLLREMPKLTDYLSYRIIDVSSIKELATRWFPKITSTIPKKKLAHRALEDIIESIDELKFYRKNVFRHDDSVEAEVEGKA